MAEATESSWLDVQGGVVLPRNAHWGFLLWDGTGFLWRLCFLGKGKQRADKNRARVEENFLKLTHVQRQEAAQSRREEKKRAEKERIMNEEDPEKQRRLEVRCSPPLRLLGLVYMFFMLYHLSPFVLPKLPIYLVLPPALFEAHDLALCCCCCCVCVSKCINTTCSVFIMFFCIFSGLSF